MSLVIRLLLLLVCLPGFAKSQTAIQGDLDLQNLDAYEEQAKRTGSYTVTGSVILGRTSRFITIQNPNLTTSKFEEFLTSVTGVFPGLTQIGRNLEIRTWKVETIDDFSNLASIGGDLVVDTGFLGFGSKSSFERLSGFGNLRSIGGSLVFHDPFTSVNGFGRLQDIGGALQIQLAEIDNLTFLTGLRSIGGDLSLQNMPNLTDVNGLTELTYISGDLHLENLRELVDIDGLSSVSEIGGGIRIHGNGSVALEGLSGLNSVGGAIILSGLPSLDGLQGLTSVQDSLVVRRSRSLVILQGLENIDTINGDFRLEDLQSLRSVSHLSSLTEVTGDLVIAGINATRSSFTSNITEPRLGTMGLETLEGLEDLKTIGGDLIIQGNAFLANFDALQLDSVGGEVRIQSSRGEVGRSSAEGFAQRLRSKGITVSVLSNALPPHGDRMQITGRVTDQSGNLLPGTEVVLSGDGDGSVLTGQDGTFLFDDLLRGIYTVTPSRPDYAFTPTRATYGTFSNQPEILDFSARLSVTVLSGWVRLDAEDGQGIEDVEVTLTSSVDTFRTTTNDNGFYAMRVPDGTYRVSFDKALFDLSRAPSSVTFEAQDREVNVVAQEKLASVFGRVLAEGRAIQGIRVVLAGESADTIITDTSGLFRFDDLVPGRYTIAAAGEGFAFDQPATVDVGGQNISLRVEGVDASPVVSFVDTQVESAVREQLSSPIGDLREGTVSRVTSLLIRGDATSLEGIDKLLSLRSLDISNTRISDLGPLSSLSSLRSLTFSNTQVTDLAPLSSLPSLSSITAAENEITDVSPLAGLPSLTSLRLVANDIGDISPLAGLTQLRVLDLSGSPIRDAGGLSNLTSLKFLDLHRTGIMDLDFLERMEELQSLGVTGNRIEDVSIFGGGGGGFDIDRDGEVGFSDFLLFAAAFGGARGDAAYDARSDFNADGSVDFSDFLSFAGAFGSQVSITSGFPILEELILSENPIEDASAIGALTSLKQLEIRDAQLSDADFAESLPHLERLFLGGNSISTIPRLSSDAERLSVGLNDNEIQDLSPLSSWQWAGDLSLHLGYNAISDLSSVVEDPHFGESVSLSLWGNPLSQNAFAVQLDQLRNVGVDVDFSATYSPPASVSGRVVNGRGEGVEGITIIANDGRTVRDSVLTLEDGSFSFTQLPPDSYFIRPTTIGVYSPPRSELIILSGIDVVDIQFVYTAPAQISGRVLSGQGEGIPSIFLRLSGLGSIVIDSVFTDRDGAFIFPDLIPGNYYITSSVPGTLSPARQDAELGSTDIQDIEFRYTPLEGISGRVVDVNGAGVADVAVVLDGVGPLNSLLDTVSTDSEGNYLFGDIPAERYRILLADDDLRFIPLLHEVELGGAAIANLDFVEDIPVTFADTRLDSAVRARLFPPLEGQLWSADLSSVSSLFVNFLGVTSLEGIQYLSNLKSCFLSSNSIRDLEPLSGLAEMTTLWLSQNDIEDISPLSNLSKLTVLTLSFNEISDISPLSELQALSEVRLGHNQIVDLAPLGALSDLRKVHLDNNNATSLAPLVENPGLGVGDSLWVRGNPLSMEALEVEIPALEAKGVFVDVDDVDDVPAPPDTSTGVPITIADTGLEAAIRSSIGKASGSLTTTDVEDIILLSASFREIVSLEGIQHLTSLRFLFLTRNQISDISPLSGMESLIHVDLQLNSIAEISSLATLTGLQTLALDNNEIHDVSALGDLASLSELGLLGNPLTDLTPVAGLSSLRSIRLGAHANIDLQDLISLLQSYPSLTSVRLRSSGVEDLAFLQHFTALESLDLRDNSISDISSLSSFTSLTRLDLSQNPIGDLSVLSSLSNLRDLELRDLDLVELDFLEGLVSLTRLILQPNNIVDISPLRNLIAIETLTLSNNAISDLASLSELEALKTLDLTSNQISDLTPLLANTGLGSGDRISLGRNPLSDEALDDQIPELEARGVSVSK